MSQRYAEIRRRLQEAAQRSGRDPKNVTVLAVSKRQPVSLIEQAKAEGMTTFGENYAQELAEKRAQINNVQWHFIGRVQRNKIKLLLGVPLLHSVDSTRLLHAINARAAAAGLVQSVLIAVNLANEAGKSGVAPNQIEELVAACRHCTHVVCRGLMTMPPWPNAPEDNRPYFRLLATLRDNLDPGRRELSELSMGTSGDFEVAVEEGATILRIGTALLGARPRSA